MSTTEVPRRTLGAPDSPFVGLQVRFVPPEWWSTYQFLTILFVGLRPRGHRGIKAKHMHGLDRFSRDLPTHIGSSSSILTPFRFLNNHKKLVRDRSDFEENRLDPAALEASLFSGPAECVEADKEDGEEVVADPDDKVRHPICRC